MQRDERPIDGDIAASGRSGPSARLIVGGVLVLFFVLFFLNNGDETEIDFMVFEWDTTVRWSIFIAFVLGVVCDRLFTSWWRHRKKRNQKKA